MLPWSLTWMACPCTWCTPMQHETKLKLEALHFLALPWLAKQGRQDSLLISQLQYKHFIETGKSQSNHKVLWPLAYAPKGQQFLVLIFSRTLLCSAAMKTTSDKNKILFSGKEYFTWSSQILKKNLSFFFQNEKQVRWRFVSEQTKQVFVVTWFYGQRNT